MLPWYLIKHYGLTKRRARRRDRETERESKRQIKREDLIVWLMRGAMNGFAHNKILITAITIFSIIAIPLQLVCVCQAQTAEEKAALLQIKAAVGGASSNMSAYWNDTSVGGPCTDNWPGVTCDYYNKIIGLNVSAFGLQGNLPSNAFANLPGLQILDFSENNLQSPLPTFNQLGALQVVNFTSNNLHEAFPSSLLGVTTLVELRLDNNFLIGTIPEGISNLKLLEQLWLGNNTFSGPLPQGLSSLVSLQTLTAWGVNLDMQLPPEWGVWVNLTYLNLHNAKLSGPLPEEWGYNFTKLQRLSLYNNDLTGTIPESWKGMTSLIEVKMKNNELTGSVPTWMSQLEHENATVDFSCNYLTGSYPNTFNDTTWKGNCFDQDPRNHDQRCDGGQGCAAFLARSNRGSSFSTGAIAGVAVGVVVLLFVILFFVLWVRRHGSKRRRRDIRGQGDPDWTVPQGVRRFTHREIIKATKSFDKSCEIGEGGFGKVYVAKLEGGKYVAIKRASDMSVQGTKEFQNEITLLSRLHHRHLVQLEGFCDDRDEQILVYEYMKNGNLHLHLFGDKHASTLNWYRRLEIALAVAQGLDYLHSFANPAVIHRDVKPSNILLDENMVAKVSDFGISKANPEMDTHVSTRPAGTAGYLDPEYFLRRQLTTASDVYGYGVVLLELITGQLAIDHKRLEDYNLVGWVKPKLVRKGIHAVIDPRLGPNFPVEAYTKVAELAVDCTAFERGDRPTMQVVATTLEHVLSSLVPPAEHMMPVFSPSFSPSTKGKETNSKSHSSKETTACSHSNTEPLSDTKMGFDFNDTVVEPR